MIYDKDYCCSSYLTFRYIAKEGVNFFEGLDYVKSNSVLREEDAYPVKNVNEIDEALQEITANYDKSKTGILLSGGMDSANLASYMPDCHAYTFRFLNGRFQQEELARAEAYAKEYGLKLHYVDINWDTCKSYMPKILKFNQAPIHSIVPQVVQALEQAKKDGIEVMVSGLAADSRFGGLDKILSKDWEYREFIDWFTYCRPEVILKKPINMDHVFEEFKTVNGGIDITRFIAENVDVESDNSFELMSQIAQMPIIDPYFVMRLTEPLDLERIRSGESKYLIRDLFRMRYPNIQVPNKVPMPRPVDFYFKDWRGPIRSEFRDDIDMSKLTGNQKWQLWCLEEFLNLYDPQ